MKLSFSNIGWNHADDAKILGLLKEYNFSAIEIAPTVITDDPCNNMEKLLEYTNHVNEKYGMSISSMQSIWYGVEGNIFNHDDSRRLLEYTRQVIDLASKIGCHNIVFGCPKNRILPEGQTSENAVNFFKELGDYAETKNTILALEANPTIYGTNFINRTSEAFDFVKKVRSKGFKVNLDFGTIVYNQEKLPDIFSNLELVNHVHVSEPNLLPIEKRDEHIILADELKKQNYEGYISVEMKNPENDAIIKEIIEYIARIFG